MSEVKRARPFLRWPGGKRQLAEEIINRFPAEYGTYFEPFVGSGAVFFDSQPTQAVLGDVSPELVNAYLIVRDEVQALIEWLTKRRQSKDAYYRIRDLRPRSQVERAGRFIYLNRLAFNGIWRVNRAGDFNVPYGFRPRRDLVEAHSLRRASSALGHARIEVGDFETVLQSAVPGDLVYADPPYTARHSHNGFRKYNDNLFSWEDQERLARVMSALASRGVAVLVSNADSESVLSLYPDFEPIRLERSSRVAARADARGRVTELLLTTSPTMSLSDAQDSLSVS